jgi:hypothetical protein
MINNYSRDSHNKATRVSISVRPCVCVCVCVSVRVSTYISNITHYIFIGAKKKFRTRGGEKDRTHILCPTHNARKRFVSEIINKVTAALGLRHVPTRY